MRSPHLACSLFMPPHFRRIGPRISGNTLGPPVDDWQTHRRQAAYLEQPSRPPLSPPPV